METPHGPIIAVIVKKAEKDNPNPFCRGSYLASNAGKLAYCWGRTQRFPQMRDAYLAEMKLAIGDVMIQCRLVEKENEIEHFDLKQCKKTKNYSNTPYEQYCTQHEVELHIASIMHDTSLIMRNTLRDEYNREEIQKRTHNLFASLVVICCAMQWDIEQIEHLGFIHTIEKFEKYVEDGWK